MGRYSKRRYFWKGTWFMLVMFLASITTIYGIVNGMDRGGIGITKAEGKTMPYQLNMGLAGGIVGTWVESNIEHEMFRFLENGKMVTQDGKHYAYRIEDERIVLTGQEGDQRVWEVSIKGNSMTIEYMSVPGRKDGRLTRSEFGVKYLKKS